ncbi:MAG: ERF family protein [Spirochaetota bacterium]
MPEDLTLWDALAKAQAEFQPVVFDSVGKVKYKERDGRAGGEFQYRYASLAAVLAAVRPALNKWGIFLGQGIEHFISDGKAFVRITTSLRKGTATLDTALALPCMESTPQAIGGIITYGRRYTLTAMLGLAAEDDDDANGAQGNVAEIQHKPKPAPVRAPAAVDKAAERLDEFRRAWGAFKEHERTGEFFSIMGVAKEEAIGPRIAAMRPEEQDEALKNLRVAFEDGAPA